MFKKNILLLITAFPVALGLVLPGLSNPPTKEEINAKGLTFKQLAEIQAERNTTFPVELRRVGSLPQLAAAMEPEQNVFGRCLSNITSACDSLRDNAKCYSSAAARYYFPTDAGQKEILILKKYAPNKGDGGLFRQFAPWGQHWQ